jgi:hypothetical protein
MTYDDLTDTEQETVLSAMLFFGFPTDQREDVDICESGQVYFGLTEILHAESVTYK